MRTYETICITKVDMPEDKFNALVDRVKANVAAEGKGEWLYSDDWGKAKISYKIGKDTRGRWTYMRYRSKPEGVDEILRGLSINEFVLRQLTCRTKEDGTDYEAYRANIMKDVAERGERPRDFREERRDYRGPRRDYGDRGGSDESRSSGGDFEGGDDAGEESSGSANE